MTMPAAAGWKYLHKVPNGYCGLEGTGVSCPLPFALGVTVDTAQG